MSEEGVPEEGIRTDVGRYTGETTTPIESATIILLRDGDAGPEVFMLERHIESDFAGGAYVFPGGRVDDTDRAMEPGRWTGLDVVAAAEAMDAPADLALGWYVAAVRETFEEAGFLFATRVGEPVTASDLDEPGFVGARRRLASRDERWDWRPWLEQEGLVLDLSRLRWWSWWVTPHGLHKRYETRFFVAPVPEDQIGSHDRVEVVDSRWTTPADALRAAADRQVTIVYPTRENLKWLAEYASVGEILAAPDRGEVDLRRHLPEVVRLDDGSVRVKHPYSGDLDRP